MLNVLQERSMSPSLTLPLHLHPSLDLPPPPPRARRGTRKGHLLRNHLHQPRWVLSWIFIIEDTFLRHNIPLGREITLGGIYYYNTFCHAKYADIVCFYLITIRISFQLITHYKLQTTNWRYRGWIQNSY